MDASKEEQRAIIHFLIAEGISVVDMHRCRKNVYRNNCISLSYKRSGVRDFKDIHCHKMARTCTLYYWQQCHKPDWQSHLEKQENNTACHIRRNQYQFFFLDSLKYTWRVTDSTWMMRWKCWPGMVLAATYRILQELNLLPSVAVWQIS